MFSKKEVEQTIKDFEAKSSFLPEIPPGGYILTVSNIELKYAKSSKQPMIVFELTLDDKHRPLRYNTMLGGDGSDIAKKIFTEFLFGAFNYTMKPCANEDEVLEQVEIFKGEKVQVAVKGKQSLISKKNEKGEDSLQVITRSEYWYANNVSDKTFSVDESKLIQELSKKDKQRFAALKALKDDKINDDDDDEQMVFGEKAKSTPKPDPKEEEQLDDLPF